MTKPARQRRKDARPEEILAAAMAEFDARGFSHTSFAQIARRAGISRTTIYLYYDTKEAILEAAIRHAIERAIDDVAGLVADAEGDFRSLLTRVINLIYARLVQGEAVSFFKILVSEGHLMPDLVAFYRTEILAKGERAMQALIERGIAMGELSPACRADDVRVFVGPAIAAALWTKVFDQVEPLDIEAYRASHIRLLGDALLARE